MSILVEQQLTRGGAFLTEACNPAETFTPEDFTEEHRMIAETTRRFVDNEVAPRTDELEKHNWALARDLIRKAADLGLIGANISAEYGGLALDQTSGALIAENLGRSASFATTFGAQTGIGLLPIVHFGTEAAKRKYLPQIAQGELITAYALTEAGSGSDALAARTTAQLSEDGTCYILNGEKIFVTNGGFADIFVVFAKVNGRKFTAFIVDAQERVTRGVEERKLGIRGSSTTSLVLTDAKVPRDNVLGEVGMGHKIAFGILNIGRCKLGAMCVGAMKLMVHQAARYADQRQQFGKSISSFGAIRAKLAEMAIRTWVGESMVYRTLGMMEATRAICSQDSELSLRGMEEYAAECSIIKVALSEYCNYAADEMVQIYGGYGYSADYPAERAYRDSRINRIFEGTNEINRLLVSSRLMKSNERRSTSTHEVIDEPDFAEGGLLTREWKLLHKAKKLALTSLGLAAQMTKLSLAEQQVIMMGIADVIIDTYAMESAILRTQKLGVKRAASCYLDMTQVFCGDAIQRIEATVKNTLSAIDESDELSALLAEQPQLSQRNTVAARQRVAKALVEVQS